MYGEESESLANAVAEVTDTGAVFAFRVVDAGDGAVSVVAGRVRAAFARAHAFRSREIVGLADAVVTEHPVATIRRRRAG